MKLSLAPPTVPGAILLLADKLNNRLRAIAANGAAWTLPSTGISAPISIVADTSTGLLVVADGAGALKLVAGNGSTTTVVTAPVVFDIAIGALGTLYYLADYTGHRVLSLTSSGGGLPGTWGAPVVLAGTGAAGGADGPGPFATFNSPASLALVGGTLYVAEWSGHRIRAVSTATGAVSLLAGRANGAAGGEDGRGSSASFNNPYALATDGAAYLYLVEYTGAKLRRIELPTGLVDTLVGSVSVSPPVNGLGYAAALWRPRGLVYSGAGPALYMLDGHQVRVVTCSSGLALPSGTPSPSPGLHCLHHCRQRRHGHTGRLPAHLCHLFLHHLPHPGTLPQWHLCC